jgi:hypothetical protein
MLPAGFEPAIPTSERPQTNALDSAANGIGSNQLAGQEIRCSPFKFINKLTNSDIQHYNAKFETIPRLHSIYLGGYFNISLHLH